MNLIAVAACDYIGIILLIALLISSRIRRADTSHMEFRIFSFITIMTMVACVVDFFSFYLDGKSGTLMRVLCILCNTYSFIANPVFIACWCLYEDIKLYHSKKRVKRIYTYAFIPAIILALLAVANLFFPMVFYLDEFNVYHRLPLCYAYYLVDFGYLIFSIVILNRYEDRYGKVRFFPLYLIIGPIVMGCLLQNIFYGVSLIWVSMSVGLTAIYMSLQNEFSYLDKLTGLFNRAYLDYYLENCIKEKNTRMGGIMIDVDYFKSINDTFGHHAGDEALVDVARVILFAKPDKAVATRFAGDEFIILLKGTNDKEMQHIIKNLRDELDLFNETESREYKLSLSLGYALFEPGKDSLDIFLKQMDDNMYQEKDLKHSKD